METPADPLYSTAVPGRCPEPDWRATEVQPGRGGGGVRCSTPAPGPAHITLQGLSPASARGPPDSPESPGGLPRRPAPWGHPSAGPPPAPTLRGLQRTARPPLGPLAASPPSRPGSSAGRCPAALSGATGCGLPSKGPTGLHSPVTPTVTPSAPEHPSVSTLLPRPDHQPLPAWRLHLTVRAATGPGVRLSGQTGR